METTRVYIVDDDAPFREALAVLPKTAGYACETFASAEEFLGRKAFDGIGCIVLDLLMLGMSGLDLQ